VSNDLQMCNRKMKLLHFIIVYEQGEWNDARVVQFSLVCEQSEQ